MSKKQNFNKNVTETYNSPSSRTSFNRHRDRPKDHGSTVYVHNGNVDSALKRLKLLLDADDRQKEIARHEYYEKPSIRRKRMKSQAIKRENRRVYDGISNGTYRPTLAEGKKHLKKKKQQRKNYHIEETLTKLRKVNNFDK